jgi:outer membrane receptor protein involved in Fe transport
MNRSVFYFSALSLSLAIAGGAAADPAQPKEDQATDVARVIVTGNRPAVNVIPLKAPYTESTITPEAILNITPSPAMTVQTLLNTQPSIYATTGATNGMETDIKFRSFADGEFGETIAGVPLNDIFNSGVTYQADNRNNALLITRDLDSVQIYRGVNNPAVNTYNSLGGTINYVPRQPTATPGGDMGVDGGSFGTVNWHVTLNTGDWHGVRQMLTFESDYSNGWLQNTSDRNTHVYYAGSADLGRNTNLFGYFIYNHNHGNAPQFIPESIINQTWNFQWPTNLYKSDNTDTNYLAIVGFKTQAWDHVTIEDEAYYGDNDYKRTSFSNPDYPGPYFLDDGGFGFPFWTFFYVNPPGYGPGDPAFDSFGDSVHATDYHFYGYHGSILGDRLQITADLPNNKITFGGDVNYGRLYSREYWYGMANMPKIVGYNDAWDEHDTRTMWSIYIQDDIHLWNDRIHITPGVKYISAHTTDSDALGFFYQYPGTDSANEHFISPTVGASVELLPNFTIYGAYGRNVKFPDITAFYNAVGNGTIAPIVVQPEYAQDYEIGARYKLKNYQAELNFYQEDFTNIIFSSTDPSGNFTQYHNGGNQRYRGVELQLTGDFGQVVVGSLKGYLNASYNEAVCTTVTLNDLTGQKCDVGQSLPNIPKYLANIGLIWDYAGWHVDLEGHYVGAQTLQSFFSSLPITPGELEPGQLTEVPSYFLVNIGVIKVIPVKWGFAKAIRLAFHVDNLFDKRYFSAGQVNTRTIDPAGDQVEDFYGLAGEPRAFFGSVGLYF